jgi:hypothetical protein
VSKKCDREASKKMRSPRPPRGCGKKKLTGQDLFGVPHSLSTVVFLYFDPFNGLLKPNMYLVAESRPIPMSARSKTWVCGRSLAGIARSNPPGAWISVPCECCVLSGRCLSSGGVLPSVCR